MSPPFSVDLSGKTVIVTGAGQGIGKVYARAVAAAGAKTVVADIHEGNAAAVAGTLDEAGHRALAAKVDVADEASIAGMIDMVDAELGGCDILVNNAALYTALSRGTFDEIRVEEWRRTMDVNVTGSFLCARAVLPHMKEAGWGRIVNISSGTVALGRPNYLHYVTSKAAIIGMTRSMAREMGGHNINVNCIMPGLIDTEIEDAQTDEVWDLIVSRQAIPRREVPEDLVGALLYLCSSASDFVTGQTIAVDGGLVHL